MYKLLLTFAAISAAVQPSFIGKVYMMVLFVSPLLLVFQFESYQARQARTSQNRQFWSRALLCF
jgi:hypothetical protein